MIERAQGWKAEWDLSGWGEIAAHLDKSVRTVQRWARRKYYPLPVFRLDDTGEIVASSRALDLWVEQRPATRLDQVDVVK